MPRPPPTWHVYTDGSAKAGDGGPGGWGFVLRPPDGGVPLEGYGQAIGTIAKVMEYRAVAEALEHLPEGAHATVFADNQSLVENLEKRLASWRESRFANVDPLVVDSVRRTAETIATRGLEVRWQWLRGHNGNAGNERADALAAQGAREAKASLAGAKRPRRS